MPKGLGESGELEESGLLAHDLYSSLFCLRRALEIDQVKVLLCKGIVHRLIELFII